MKKRNIIIIIILLFSINIFSDEIKARLLFEAKEYESAVKEYIDTIKSLKALRDNYKNNDKLYNKYSIKLILTFEGFGDSLVEIEDYYSAYQAYRSAYYEYVHLFKRYYEDKEVVKSKLNTESSFIRIQDKVIKLQEFAELKEKNGDNEESEDKQNENIKSDDIPEVIPPDFLFERRVDENGNVIYDGKAKKDEESESEEKVKKNNEDNVKDSDEQESKDKEITSQSTMDNKSKKDNSSIEYKEDTYEIQEDNILYSIDIDGNLEEKISEKDDDSEEIKEEIEISEKKEEKKEEQPVLKEEKKEPEEKISIEDKDNTFEQKDNTELYSLEFLKDYDSSEKSSEEMNENELIEKELEEDEQKDKRIIITSGEGIAIDKNNTISVKKSDKIIINSKDGFTISSNGKTTSISEEKQNDQTEEETESKVIDNTNNELIEMLKTMEEQQNKEFSQTLADIYEKIANLENQIKEKQAEEISNNESDKETEEMKKELEEMKKLFEERENKLKKELEEKIAELEAEKNKETEETSTVEEETEDQKNEYVFGYIYLIDGSRISGYIIEMTDSFYLIETNFPVDPIAKKNIEKIEFRLEEKENVNITLKDGTKVSGTIRLISSNTITIITKTGELKIIEKDNMAMVKYN